MYEFFAIYLILINLISILICIYDKWAAKNDKWRIPEKSLFMFTLLGGSIGMYFTMLKIRHKTLHTRFMVGIPFIIVFQIIFILFIIYLTVNYNLI